GDAPRRPAHPAARRSDRRHRGHVTLGSADVRPPPRREHVPLAAGLRHHPQRLRQGRPSTGQLRAAGRRDGAVRPRGPARPARRLARRRLHRLRRRLLGHRSRRRVAAGPRREWLGAVHPGLQGGRQPPRPPAQLHRVGPGADPHRPAHHLPAQHLLGILQARGGRAEARRARGHAALTGHDDRALPPDRPPRRARRAVRLVGGLVRRAGGDPHQPRRPGVLPLAPGRPVVGHRRRLRPRQRSHHGQHLGPGPSNAHRRPVPASRVPQPAVGRRVPVDPLRRRPFAPRPDLGHQGGVPRRLPPAGRRRGPGPAGPGGLLAGVRRLAGELRLGAAGAGLGHHGPLVTLVLRPFTGLPRPAAAPSGGAVPVGPDAATGDQGRKDM
ncbi:MAG: hypothetical protein AVDCRST_MAG76-1499, partial [uncultured Acidimicrobiales bacterium]